jgi:tRNA threonylcarbamoyl adenosine modification protein (Sua5/YciO/YrdC/YwlC family)
MIIEIHPKNPDVRKIAQVIAALEKGAVIIYPTDTVYGIGCDIQRIDAIEKICRLRKLNPEKANLTIICESISQMSEYTTQIDNATFKAIKRHTPGAFTFILKAGHRLPKTLKNRKLTVGVRIPDSPIALAIVRALGRPILSASLKQDIEPEYLTDPTEIAEVFEHQTDIVINGGEGSILTSTIIDCTTGMPTVLREGVGEWDG